MEKKFDSFENVIENYKIGMSMISGLEFKIKKGINIFDEWRYIKSVQSELNHVGFQGADSLISLLIQEELSNKFSCNGLECVEKNGIISIAVDKVKIFEIDVDKDVLYDCCNTETIVDEFKNKVYKKNNEIDSIKKDILRLEDVYNNFGKYAKSDCADIKKRVLPYKNRRIVESRMVESEKVMNIHNKRLRLLELQCKYLELVMNNVESVKKNILKLVTSSKSEFVLEKERRVMVGEYVNNSIIVQPPSKYIKLAREKTAGVNDSKGMEYNPGVDYLSDLINSYVGGVKNEN